MDAGLPLPTARNTDLEICPYTMVGTRFHGVLENPTRCQSLCFGLFERSPGAGRDVTGPKQAFGRRFDPCQRTLGIRGAYAPPMPEGVMGVGLGGCLRSQAAVRACLITSFFDHKEVRSKGNTPI